jgi:hypothetical protein
MLLPVILGFLKAEHEPKILDENNVDELEL